MKELPVVEAIIVNHNTSVFAELCLRSLKATEESFLAQLRVTVADNHSDDPGLTKLRLAAGACDATFRRTRWPAHDARVNTHGDVLRDFVLEHDDADYFLFLDADIVFVEHNTIATMLTDLASNPSWWATQAGFVNAERTRGPGSSLDIGAGNSM